MSSVRARPAWEEPTVIRAMTHVCCPRCRLRFTPAAAAHLVGCPECAGSPQTIARARDRVPSVQARGPSSPGATRGRRLDSRFRAARSAIATDRHMRILQLMAHAAQRELRNHDAVDPSGDAVSVDRRQHLGRAATRTSVRVARGHGGATVGQVEFPDRGPRALARWLVPSSPRRGHPDRRLLGGVPFFVSVVVASGRLRV